MRVLTTAPRCRAGLVDVIAVIAVIAGVVAIAAVAGCPRPGDEVPCVDDDDCGGGMVCVASLCLDPVNQRLRQVDLQIDGSAVGIPVQSVFDVELDIEARTQIALAPAVPAAGLILSGVTGVPAFVVARPERAIAGRSLAPSDASASDGSFRLTLVEGRRYDLSLVPVNPALPPVFVDVGLVARASPLGEQVIPPLQVPRDVIHVTGVVQAGEGVAAQGIAGLSVKLIDERGFVWSSVGRTGTDGAFDLTLAEPRTGLALAVTPTADNGTWPAVQMDDVDVTADLDLGVVNLGSVAAPRRFVARVFDSAGSPVAGAHVALRANLGSGTFARLGASLADGRVDELVPPGRYDLAVAGPSTMASAGLLLVEGLELPLAGASFALRLPPRPTWSGAVRDRGGVGVGGTVLELVRVGDVSGRAEAILGDLAVAFVAKADDVGAFSVAVDPGRYRVRVRPPPASRAPSVSVLVTVPFAGLLRDVELPARGLVVGRALAEGAPVRAAWVQVFSTLKDERGAAIQLGAGPADDQGAFEIVVPDVAPEDDVDGASRSDP